MADNVFTWEEYKRMVSGLVQNNDSFFCRGHADESWKLQTSFHRISSQKNITLIQYLDVIVPEVQYFVSAIRDEIINCNDNLEFGAFFSLLQHHGFPTPLLDWTLSPYIAAYFAFREVHDQYPNSDHVKIYIFDYLEWTKSFEQIYDLRDSKNFVSALRPYAKYNPRIIPQQGRFTVTNIDDIEQYIYSRSEETKKTFLYSARLSVKEKPHILKELNLMGINEMSLFPSIEGVCRALKHQFFSADIVGPTFSERMEQYKITTTNSTNTPEIEVPSQKRRRKKQ